MHYRTLLGLFFVLLTPFNIEAHQTCQEAYTKTSQSFRKGAFEVTQLAIASPVLGIATIFGGPIYYAGKTLNDFRILVIGSDEKQGARLEALGRMTVKNPRDAIAAIGSGALASLLGLPEEFSQFQNYPSKLGIANAPVKY